MVFTAIDNVVVTLVLHVISILLKAYYLKEYCSAELNAPYIPMAKARGFTALSDKR